MGWFNRSLKGEHSVGTENNDPSQASSSSTRPGIFSSRRPNDEGKHEYDPRSAESQSFAPPPRPPPSQEFSPPPGPPSSYTGTTSQPPQYHDWTSVPDTALLPPPPSLGHEASTASNASETEAIRAKDWCRRHPITQPTTHDPNVLTMRHTDNYLNYPHEFRGKVSRLDRNSNKVISEGSSPDACLISNFPHYAQSHDCPLYTERHKTIYFEVQILSLGRAGIRGAEQASISLGFLAAPYPSWRQPGWERGSLGVHGDDGRRYVNDSYGGKDFTAAFTAQERIGIGMSFSLSENPTHYESTPAAGPRMGVEVFLTRNGQKCGGWDLHEERDANEDLGVEGLEGLFDLYAAVGVFGAVEFDVLFDERAWLFTPES
ncbi:MAG: hypothetical protein M1837_006931 [Sclerophora amabilis]|nr:MAG: hypothetical protein M1837_006931 [Sclerophora amabilis]